MAAWTILLVIAMIAVVFYYRRLNMVDANGRYQWMIDWFLRNPDQIEKLAQLYENAVAHKAAMLTFTFPAGVAADREVGLRLLTGYTYHLLEYLRDQRKGETDAQSDPDTA